MTHAELVQRAGAWLKGQGCGLVFTEMVTSQCETPDAIGWRNRGDESFLIECKASRSDFHADKHKSFRSGITPGMGRYRYYMCEPGIIKLEDLPPRWGLLYCHPKKVEFVAGKSPRNWDQSLAAAFMHEPDQRGEMRMLYSALSRLRVDMGVAQFHARVHLPYTSRLKERQAAAA